MTPKEKEAYIEHVMRTCDEHDIPFIMAASTGDDLVVDAQACKTKDLFIGLLAAFAMDYPAEFLSAMMRASKLKIKEREREHKRDDRSNDRRGGGIS